MDTIVRTRSGQIRGTSSGGVHRFLGVPYAAPPVGANRLRAPQPVPPWTGVRDATALGPEPPQPAFGIEDVSGLLFDPAVVGDDCLNLNFWTPYSERRVSRSWCSAPVEHSSTTPAAATTAVA